jgi:hypothetical protein
MAMKPLGGGDFDMGDTTRNIIKTALDRNQRVVITNTCVFFFPFLTGLTFTFTSLPTHSKPENRAYLV